MENRTQNCRSCGSASLSPLGSGYPATLCRCSYCRLVQFTTDPTEAELVAHYENYPVTGGISEITRKRYSDILDLLEPFRKNGRILDIGCGEGFFLEEAKRRNWEVYGTEFSSIYLPICKNKGISMMHGRLEIANYTPHSFDVITWFEVIEHINTPNQEIDKFKYLLRPGGAVYLTTPNIDSFSRSMIGPKWTAITYPDHLCYYSPTSIKILFSRNGFRPVKIMTTGISIGRLQDSLKGDISMGNQRFHEIDKQWQKRLEKNGPLKWLKSAVNFLLRVSGKGDSLKALFKLDP